MEFPLDSGGECHLAFIDFRAAFDSVSHSALFEGLKSFNIDPSILDLIVDIYSKATVQPRVQRKNGTRIRGPRCRVERGVLQGDVFSPMLFCLVLDILVKGLDKKINVNITGQNVFGKVTTLSVTSLEYADDMVLFSTDRDLLQKQFDIFRARAKRVDLDINAKKTKSMHVNKQRVKIGPTTESDCAAMNWKHVCDICSKPFPGWPSVNGHRAWCKPGAPYPHGKRAGTLADKLVREKKLKKLKSDTQPLMCDSAEVEDVYYFEYLGSGVSYNNKCTLDIKQRINKATAAWRCLFNVWSDSRISLRSRYEILEMSVSSVLLYGSESWPRDKESMILLRQAWRRFAWPIEINNTEHAGDKESVRAAVERAVQSLLQSMEQRRLSFAGHILRRSEDSLLFKSATLVSNPVQNRTQLYDSSSVRRSSRLAKKQDHKLIFDERSIFQCSKDFPDFDEYFKLTQERTRWKHFTEEQSLDLSLKLMTV